MTAAWLFEHDLKIIEDPAASALVRSLPISGHVLGCFVRMLWKPTSVWRAFEYQCSFTRLMARRKSNMLWQKVSGLILWIDSDKLATGVVAAGAHNWYSQDFLAWRLKQTFFWCYFCSCGLPKLGTSNYIEVQTSGWKSKKQINNKFTGTQWYSMLHLWPTSSCHNLPALMGWPVDRKAIESGLECGMGTWFLEACAERILIIRISLKPSETESYCCMNVYWLMSILITLAAKIRTFAGWTAAKHAILSQHKAQKSLMHCATGEAVDFSSGKDQQI